MKTPYRDGTTHVIFEPPDFIARLAALRLPRVNLIRYFPRRFRAQQPVPRAGDGVAGQRRFACHDGRHGGANAGRTPGLDDRAAFETGRIDIETRPACGGAVDYRLHRGSR
ncbi:MAG: hypothetical protein IPF57_17365, partial [Gammaproteobacteria bacterium]|nr:hypothetical protein [Gammaproteobacteria bacterium]